MAGVRLIDMAISLASTDTTFIVWICAHLTMMLSFKMWVTAVAMPDFLTPLSAMTAVSFDADWEWQKIRLSFWMCLCKSLSLDEKGKWNVILLEKWSTTLYPGEKRECKGSKDLVISDNHLLTSLMGLMSFCFCLSVKFDVKNLCWVCVMTS